MEQYWTPKELDFENLRLCIDNHFSTYLFIRLVGSVAASRGVEASKINENLENKNFDFKKDDSGLYLLIDSNEVFHFPLKDYHKGFSVAYERIESTEDGIGRMIMLSHGINPYDLKLPEPRKSTLRTVLDDHLMEIDFKERIHLKFHSWWEKPYWKNWTVDLFKKKKADYFKNNMQAFIKSMKNEIPKLEKEIDSIILNKEKCPKKIEKTLNIIFDYVHMGLGKKQFIKLNSYYKSVNPEYSNEYYESYKEIIKK